MKMWKDSILCKKYMNSKPEYIINSRSHGPRDDHQPVTGGDLPLPCFKDRDMSFLEACEEEDHVGSETDIHTEDGSLCSQSFNNQ